MVVTLGIICFGWICMKNGSMCNHQSSQDWNNLEAVHASRIKQDGKGTFQDHSISILDITASIPTHEIPGFTWKLKIWRSKRFDWRFWTLTSCSLIYFLFPFPIITWKSAICFSDSWIAHKICNCVYIASIFSFLYFISFWAIWLYHIQRSILEVYWRWCLNSVVLLCILSRILSHVTRGSGYPFNITNRN